MYLNYISEPADVKKIPTKELSVLCNEIRQRLISTVSNNGGHLASNLGAVELTVAIHKVFNSPTDSIIFDVGHQSYTHKILTGRNGKFDSLRTENGITGFMNPKESEHDPFISGHSSTSLSAGFGIAKANRLLGKAGRVVCVIGDGALTGGMAYEALNNIGRSNENMIIIINDNKMSISENVGAMAKYLSEVRTRSSYINTKESVKYKISSIPVIGNPMTKIIEKSKSTLKNAIFSQNMFEALGFYYLGPVDGNDVERMVDVMRAAKDIKNRPIVIHAVTKKGKGYDYAESDPEHFHGVSKFDSKTGHQTSKVGYSEYFGKILCDIAEKDSKICAVTAAMTDGTGLSDFARKYPDRFFDVGIAEQHAVTFAAGLASRGITPVFAVYSSFLQRAYDQIIHDCSIINQHIVFAVDRAGIVGNDGVTHQGIFDVAFLSEIPNVRIFAPSNFAELNEMLHTALYDCNGVCAVRYPRGTQIGDGENRYNGEKFSIINQGNDNKLIITYGNLFNIAYKTGCSVCKLNELCVDNMLLNAITEFDDIYFFEEGIKSGGFGQILGDRLMEYGYKGRYKDTAIEGFVYNMSPEQSLSDCELDCESMKKIISEDPIK